MDSTGTYLQSTVLVPVDYSEYSKSACRFAAKIALKSRSRLLVFHTFYSPAFDLIELTGGIQTQQRLRKDVSKRLMESETEEMTGFLSLLSGFPEIQKLGQENLDFKLTAGLAKDEILRLSSDINPFMVVMGSRGADKKNTSVLGSVTDFAINKLNVPVLAIPENYKFISDEKLNNIVYLTDFDESDFLSIKKLLSFSQLFDMSIHCIHIGPKQDKWESLKMNGLKDYFNKAYQVENVECSILPNKPDLLQAIDAYVSENAINIISLTHKKRNLISKILKPSMTKKVFYHIEVPLLVFHG